MIGETEAGKHTREVGPGKVEEVTVFEKKYRSIIEHLESVFDSNPGYELWVTGHSLGGALASLFAFKLVASGDLAQDLPETPVTAITFAAPHVGDERFNKAFNFLYAKNKLRLLRVTNDGDVVPLGLSLMNFANEGDYTQNGLNMHLFPRGAVEVNKPEGTCRDAPKVQDRVLSQLKPLSGRYHSLSSYLKRLERKKVIDKLKKFKSFDDLFAAGNKWAEENAGTEKCMAPLEL